MLEANKSPSKPIVNLLTRTSASAPEPAGLFWTSNPRLKLALLPILSAAILACASGMNPPLA